MDGIRDRYEVLRGQHLDALIMVYEKPFYYLFGSDVRIFEELAGLPESNQASPTAAFPEMLLEKFLQLFEDSGYEIQKEPNYILCRKGNNGR